MSQVPVESLSVERLTQLRTLRDQYGDSRSLDLAPSYAAIDDLLHERDRLAGALNKLLDESTRPQEPSDPRCPLTGRHLQILTGAANGESAAVTAHRLRVGTDTVRSHRETIFRRLGVHNVTQAVVVCLINEWIAPGDIRIPGRGDDCFR